MTDYSESERPDDYNLTCGGCVSGLNPSHSHAPPPASVSLADASVSLCPHCWARHDARRYTCAFTHGYYTCGPCATRYTMPEVKTKVQVKALDDATEAKRAELYGDRDADYLGGIGMAGVRLCLRDDGWEFPRG